MKWSDCMENELDLRFAHQFNDIAPYYDEVMSVVPYRRWTKYLCKLFKRYHVQPQQILEIATGTGAIAFLLAEHEYYSVTGIDISPRMIEIAERKAHAQGVVKEKVRFACLDATQLPYSEEFDAAVCLFDSFNYILSSRGLQQAFLGAYHALRPNSLFIFDLNSEYTLENNLFTQDNLWDDTTDVKHVWTASYNNRTRIATVNMQFYLPNGKTFREVHKERAHRHGDVIDYLQQAGFYFLDAYDDYSFLPAGTKSERIVYVSRKNE